MGKELERMKAKDYDIYRSAILTANESKDKEALRQIQLQLIVRYGLNNDDVQRLLKLFRYNV